MSNFDSLPEIIQGGMGIGISNWRLARAVSQAGQLGVVSGTSIDSVMVRRLQDGDEGGHIRRAAEEFPDREFVANIFQTYYKPGGKNPDEPYKLLSLYKLNVPSERQKLTSLASFVEVKLAKDGHSGLVGINLLTKIQLPNLAVLLGAMLAEVDYVLMGAGIPKEIPGVLDNFSRIQKAELKLDLTGANGRQEFITLDPRELFPDITELKRPKFLPIISSHQLAKLLTKKSSGQVDGFIVEGPEAGGHNAPPRTKRDEAVNLAENEIFGPDDYADIEAMRAIGLPFWLAGGYGSAAGLKRAKELGANGVQVGTLFALSNESGLRPDLRNQVLNEISDDKAKVRTDLKASPTGFPFKIVELDHTLAMENVFEERERVCDLGYLREAFVDTDGEIRFRCSGEPVKDFERKLGSPGETEGRRCLCNALMATAGMPQVRRSGYIEPALVTSGSGLDDVQNILALPQIRARGCWYEAKEAVNYLLHGAA